MTLLRQRGQKAGSDCQGSFKERTPNRGELWTRCSGQVYRQVTDHGSQTSGSGSSQMFGDSNKFGCTRLSPEIELPHLKNALLASIRVNEAI